MTRIILTRHGETDWNVQHRIQGSTDVPLNENGMEQARRLAARLSGVDIHAAYSSDYQRAENTARIVLEPHNGLPLYLSEDLRERSWGDLEGLQWDEIQKKHPDAVRGVTSGSLDFAPPNGESKKTVINRIMRIMGRIVRMHPEHTVLVVTHGGIVSTFIKHALDVDVAARTPFRVENCAINVLETNGGGAWYIQTLNDMSHLNMDVP